MQSRAINVSLPHTLLQAIKNITKHESYEQYGAKIILIACVYVIFAKVGLSLALSTKQVSTVWPPTGIAMAIMLLMGYRYWPGILIGAFVANSLTAEPLFVAAIIGIGNTLEAVAGAYLIKHFIHSKNILDKIFNVVWFVILAAVLSTIISATIGVVSLALGGLIRVEQFTSVWQKWWVGDTMGALIILPLIVAWTNKRYRLIFRGHYVEAGVLFALVLVTSLVIFTHSASQSTIATPLTYLIFPLSIWAAVRFMQIGAVSVGLIVSISAIAGTLRQLGPFTNGSSIERNLIVLYFFIVVVLITSLVLASAVYQRLLSEQALKKQAEELKKSKKEILETIKSRDNLESQIKDAREKIADILDGVFSEGLDNKR